MASFSPQYIHGYTSLDNEYERARALKSGRLIINCKKKRRKAMGKNNGNQP